MFELVVVPNVFFFSKTNIFIIYLSAQTLLKKHYMLWMFSAFRECLKISVFDYRCVSISRTGWLPKKLPVCKGSGLSKHCPSRWAGVRRPKSVRLTKDPGYKCPGYRDTSVLTGHTVLRCCVHLYLLVVRCWDVYIYIYWSYGAEMCTPAFIGHTVLRCEIRTLHPFLAPMAAKLSPRTAQRMDAPVSTTNTRPLPGSSNACSSAFIFNFEHFLSEYFDSKIKRMKTHTR